MDHWQTLLHSRQIQVGLVILFVYGAAALVAAWSMLYSLAVLMIFRTTAATREQGLKVAVDMFWTACAIMLFGNFLGWIAGA